jgi:hypothetical protein
VIDVPETEQHRLRGRGRLVALGRRTDNDQRGTLLVINEADGSWSFHGLGASAGVKLSQAARSPGRVDSGPDRVAQPTMRRRSDRVGCVR